MNFEKRDIVEVCTELGLDLREQTYSDKPYLIGKCPLHDDHRPSFAIFPNVQKWVCYSCHPELGDVIDLVREIKGCSFKEALPIATYELTTEDQFKRDLQKEAKQDFDRMYLLRRVTAIFDDPRRFDFVNAQHILRKFDSLVSELRYIEAEKYIRGLGF